MTKIQGYATTNALPQPVIQIEIKLEISPKFKKVRTPEMINDIKSAMIKAKTNLKYRTGNIKKPFLCDYNIKFYLFALLCYNGKKL